MKPGKDYIGVGCGAVILNENNQILLMKRGAGCRNCVGYWAIPGGCIDRFETAEDAVKREIKEEIGVDIELLQLLSVTNDFIQEENEHWITPQFLCKIVAGTPTICEPKKCDELQWFDLHALPEKLTLPAINGIRAIKTILEKKK
ncbi:MAG: NUDIX domain-containing protein [Candidatus Woesearchaeota archaeon]|nr:NUDIX domain-containing protein [Candidatus Woesearchaeota archaeon]